MAFTAKSNYTTPHGEFEVYCSKAGRGISRNDDPIYEIEFTVRADIEQGHQGFKFRKSFWLDANDALSERDETKLGKWANSLGISAGQSFELDDLIGRSALLVSGTYTPTEGQNAGKTYDTIQLRTSKADHPYMTSVAPAQIDEVEDDDGDLPF